MNVIAALAFLFAAAASGWHDARAIVVPPAKLPAYVRLALPQDIDPGPDGTYPDLRIVDQNDQPVPYALDADRHDTPGGPVALSDVGFVPGHFTQAIADLGSGSELHSAIRLETPMQSFFEHVEIATSDDRSTWAIVVPSALIYRVDGNEYNGRTTIDFGPSRARWMRIRVLDGVHEFPISSANLPAVEPVPQLVSLAAAQSMKQSGTATVVTFDFGRPNQNLDAVAFDTSTPEFARNLVVDISAGGTDSTWQVVANPQIARYAGARYASRTAVIVGTGQQYTRLLRATIQNGDDPPLAALHVVPLGLEHHIVFQAVPGGVYRVLWGNDAAEAPVYDLGDRLKHEAWTVAAVATLGADVTPSIAVPSAAGAPWLQQAALPIALAVLFVVLLAVALIAMRRKPEP
jgi:Protein of unknown function (DUF3999)